MCRRRAKDALAVSQPPRFLQLLAREQERSGGGMAEPPSGEGSPGKGLAEFAIHDGYFQLGSKQLEAEYNKAYIVDACTQLSDAEPRLRASNAPPNAPVVLVVSATDRHAFDKHRSHMFDSASNARAAWQAALDAVSQVHCRTGKRFPLDTDRPRPPPRCTVAARHTRASTHRATCLLFPRPSCAAVPAVVPGPG